MNLHTVWVDDEERVAVFPLWNLSGQMVGYQQYRPDAGKEKKNNPKEGRYFTLRKQPTVAVWGLESFHLRSDVLFVTEGVFDAARLTEHGLPAVAALGNDPSMDVFSWLHSLGRKVVVVHDNDKAGLRLARFGHVSVTTGEKDLGESSDEEVELLLRSML
jgi:DNA primase